MNLLNVARARRLALALIGEHGSDFVYCTTPNATCRNTPLTNTKADSEHVADDDPRRVTGCLAGSIMTRAGYTFPPALAESSVRDVWYSVKASGVHLFDTHEMVRLNASGFESFADIPLVVGYLQVMQNWQDRGYSWGRAYEAAQAWLDLPNDREKYKTTSRSPGFAHADA